MPSLSFLLPTPFIFWLLQRSKDAFVAATYQIMRVLCQDTFGLSIIKFGT
jgi:hypothetical protein